MNTRTTATARRRGLPATLSFLPFLALLAFAAGAPAQSALDGFDPNANGTVLATAVQADGRILVGGQFTHIGGQPRDRIARLLPDGTLDAGFDPGADGSVYDLVVQADGGILVGGQFTHIGGQPRDRIARLHPDGTLDAGFDPGADASVHSLVLQTDGKLLVGGQFTHIASQPRNRLVRLHPDGTLDAGFDPDADAGVFDLAVQADGRILIGGIFSQIGGQVRSNIARLHPDGTLDTGFDPGANHQVRGLLVQADGKIVVGGIFSELDGQPRNRIGRLHADGSLDADFDAGLVGPLVLSLTLQPDGRIVVGGDFSQVGGQPRARIARLNPDGTLDTGFHPGTGAGGGGGTVESLLVQADGRILVAGNFTQLRDQARNRIARLYADGRLDADFVVAVDNGSVSSMAVQPDGKIVIGGSFTSIAGQVRERLARLHPDGSLDSGFDIGANSDVWTLAVQADGRILVGGWFTEVGGQVRRYLARLHPDGSLDTGFTANAQAVVWGLALQPDDKILVGGRFIQIGGAFRNRLARLHPDGSVDSFHPDVNVDVVYSPAVQADGRVVIGGNFFGGGVLHNHLARAFPDGTPDHAFHPNPGNAVYSVVAQPDGKLLAAGTFLQMGGVPRNRIARVHPDGTLDTGFVPPGAGTPPNPGPVSGAVNGITLQRDGKILAGVDSASVRRLVRLNPNGTLDAAFAADANGSVAGVSMQADGKILVGGTFTQLGGQDRMRIGRLSVPDAALQTLTVTADRSGLRWMRSGAGPEIEHVRFAVSETFDDSEAWVDLGAAERIEDGWAIDGLDATDLPRDRNLWLRAEGMARGGSSSVSTSRHRFVRVVYLGTYAVSAGIVAGNGSIDPSQQSVEPGGEAHFLVVPDPGWQVQSVSGDTCTPVDSGGGTWIAADIQADCAVSASFEIVRYTVSGTVGSGQGGITPAQQSIEHGATAEFAVTPAPGHFIHMVGGSCGGTLEGGNYTTEPVTADCTAIAHFLERATVTTWAEIDPARLGQPVPFTATVGGADSAPADGQVLISASSGESCSDASPPEIVGLEARFSCSIAFDSLGPRSVQAAFAGSTSHGAAAPARTGVAVMRVADLSIGIEDERTEAKPGEAVGYLMEVRNLGPDAAPGTGVVLTVDPALLDAGWVCTAVGAASCPAAAGSGGIDQQVDLPTGSGLDYVLFGTLPATLPPALLAHAVVTADAKSPHYVFDPQQGNNQASDVNVVDGIFADGFE